MTTAVEVGSSPRVRGKRIGVGDAGAAVGLIPARAGKTTSPPPSIRAKPAHPRACGENWSMRARRGSFQGSSPRVRGKLGRSMALTRMGGLIPARAGKTARA